MRELKFPGSKNRTAGGGGYRPDIDGLRALACLAVVVYHCFPGPLPGGLSGVDVFFVISGYLISGILYRSLYSPSGTLNLADFYIRRVRRILPALAAVLAAVWLIGYRILFPDELEALGRHLTAGALYVPNVLLYHEDAAYAAVSGHFKPLLHLWSLGVEEQFYLVFPLLLWLIYRSNLNVPFALIILTVISFFLNKNGVAHHNQAAAFYLPWCRVWELTSGALLSYFGFRHRERLGALMDALSVLVTRALLRDSSRRSLRFEDLLSAAGLGLLAWGALAIRAYGSYPGTLALIPVSGALLVIAASDRAFLNRRVLSARPLVFLGLISFPLCLWHRPLMSYAYYLYGELPGPGVRAGIAALSLALAAVTYYCIESPLRFGPRRRTAALSERLKAFSR